MKTLTINLTKNYVYNYIEDMRAKMLIHHKN